MLYIRPSDQIHLITEIFYFFFTSLSPTFPLPCPLTTFHSILFLWFFFENSIYKWYNTVFIFLIWPISLIVIPSRSICIVLIDRISYFPRLNTIHLRTYNTSSLSIHPLSDTWVALYLAYCEWCCSDQGRADALLKQWFYFFCTCAQKWNCCIIW